MDGDGDLHPDLRIGDDERNAVIAALREHTAAGRLTLGEFSDRAGAVFAARTQSELDLVTVDLPARLRESTGSADGSERRIVALVGDSEQQGRWRVARRTKVVAVLGDVTLNLKAGTFEGQEITIDALALVGDVIIVVPECMEVDLTGTPILGDHILRVTAGPAREVLPTLRVRARAVLGDVTIKS
ncbi:MAG: DUF1707 SHOCT-like domain-containing protein [Acidimicrobiales bacterium]